MPQTGPRTKNGKAKAGRNALKHGMSATAPVVEGFEDMAEWERHLAGFHDSLSPEGYLEERLVYRLASLDWRLDRPPRYETEMIVARLNEIPEDLKTAAWYKRRALGVPIEDSLTQEAVEEQIARRILPDANTLTLIMRYEAHLHRQYVQTLHELEAMQARRRGERTPLARLDITGSPSAS